MNDSLIFWGQENWGQENERIFKPLGYQVSVTAQELDSEFPDWSRSPYASVTLQAMTAEFASEKLRLLQENKRVSLIHGSLMYRDKRLADFDAASVVEIIEHPDPPRLSAFERVVFEFARPLTVVVTTPNKEYNVVWESLPAGKFRHADHRFEWTRTEFQTWAEAVAARFEYTVVFHPVGPLNETVGSPTQMAVFECSHHAPP